MKKSRKFLIGLLACLTLGVGSLGFSGCASADDDDEDDEIVTVWTVESAYLRAQEYGYTGTFSAFETLLENRVGNKKIQIEGVTKNDDGEVYVLLYGVDDLLVGEFEPDGGGVYDDEDENDEWCRLVWTDDEGNKWTYVLNRELTEMPSPFNPYSHQKPEEEYVFLGCFTEREGGEKYIDADGNILKPLPTELVLYAQYRERTAEDGNTSEELNPVDSDTIFYDGATIAWEAQSGAQGYEIYIGGTFFARTSSGVTQMQYDAGGQSFSVQIKTLGEDDLSSPISDEKQFTYVGVSGIEVVDGVLTWESVNGAQAYAVRVNNSVKQTTATKYNLIAGSNQTVSVKAIFAEDSTCFSAFSEEKSVYILSAPSVSVVAGETEATIYWNAVNGANGYRVKIQKPGGVTTEIYSVTSISKQYSFSETGTYTVSVQACGDGVEYYDSQYSSSITVERKETA